MSIYDPSDYKTGDAIPSNKAMDLNDNAKVFDVFQNAQIPSVKSRLGVDIKTMWQQGEDFYQNVENWNNTFQAQFTYKYIKSFKDANSDGEKITDATRLNAYSVGTAPYLEWWGLIQSTTIPDDGLPIPASPDENWSLINALTKEQFRSDSASQLGLVYKNDWYSGIIIPNDSLNNRSAYWHDGQFYTVTTNTGFTSSDFSFDLSAGKFAKTIITGLPKYITQLSEIKSNDTVAVLTSDITINTYTIPSDFNLHTLDLNGFKLKVTSGIFKIEVDHSFKVDFAGGGVLDLGLKYAIVDSPAPNGSQITVRENSFEVGDVISCSFDLFGMPNDTNRSVNPNGDYNYVESINDNLITLKYPFEVNRGGGAPGYTEIPAGAYLVNAIFSNPGFYYTGSGTLLFDGDGFVQNSSAGYYVTVANQAKNGSFHSRSVKYDKQGLDGFQLQCQNITFEDFEFGLAMDIAKQIIVPQWYGKMAFIRGKASKSNFDSDIYISRDGVYGDISYDNVDFSGKNNTGMTGFLGNNALYHCIITAKAAQIGKVTITDSKFPNYQRNIIGSGTLKVNSQVFESISITSSDTTTCPWLYTTFNSTSDYVSANYINISGGQMFVLGTIRSNPGFKDVNYLGVELLANGVVRFGECDISNCALNGTFSGGSFVIDDRVSVGRNTIKNGAQIAVQTANLSTTAKFIINDFDPTATTGNYFPITNYINSSISSEIPVIDLDIRNFTENVTFGSSISAARYVLQLNRSSKNNPPPDAKSRYAAIVPIGSTIKGVGDVSLYKVTSLYEINLTGDLTAGDSTITQTNVAGGQTPAIGDIVGIMYSNFVVKYHVINSVSGQTFGVNPAVYENVTASGAVIYNNKTQEIY